jgi:hypothetical protein
MEQLVAGLLRASYAPPFPSSLLSLQLSGQGQKGLRSSGLLHERCTCWKSYEGVLSPVVSSSSCPILHSILFVPFYGGANVAMLL